MTYKCGECGTENIHTWKSGETAAYKCNECGHRGNQHDEK